MVAVHVQVGGITGVSGWASFEGSTPNQFLVSIFMLARAGPRMPPLPLSL